MANLKSIRFERVGKYEGCTCDRCGQYIRNIVIVDWADGLTMRYGQDCFDKLWKDGKLNQHGKKLMRSALKSIEYWSDQLAKYQSGEINEKNDLAWQNMQVKLPYESPDYWYGREYEEYRSWIINEVIPMRFAEAQKEVNKFARVNFDR